MGNGESYVMSFMICTLGVIKSKKMRWAERVTYTDVENSLGNN
jgi:hypothetical protein